MAGLAPVIWAVWGVLALSVMILKLYTDRLSRDEDDQLVLDEAFAHVKTEQAAIVAKVHRIEPLRKTMLYLFAVASVFVVGYYVMDIVNQFK